MRSTIGFAVAFCRHASSRPNVRNVLRQLECIFRQRVFLGWAQVWRSLVRDDALRQLLLTDSHSPGAVRAFAPLRNIDEWYAAFDVKEGDKNSVKPEERVRIW